MVAAAGGVLAVFLIYLLAWQPLTAGYQRLERQVGAREQELHWMQQAAAEARSLKARAGPGGGAVAQPSLLGLIESTARRDRLAVALKKVQPEGQDGVRVWFENASFDDLMLWLDGLHRTNGVNVAEFSIDRQSTDGRVNAKILLGTGKS